ncbi:MAG: capsule biosynthesis protein [Rhodobacteraceae bacterium]|nr:capsule biosynthesis protein [Paracoccaceae bacterium]
MTTTPSIRRFRLRGQGPAKPAVPPPPAEEPATELLSAGQTDPLTATGDDAAAIEGIRAEGLTARQLRMARRVAQRHGIRAEDDHALVHELRRRGIEPFQRSSMLALVTADPATEGEGAQAGAAAPRAEGPGLPQPVREKPRLPAQPLSEGARAAEVLRIQREIARRRKRRLAGLFLRLALFVFLPTALAGWYYYRVATPFYATNTAFVIQQASPVGGGVSSLLSGTQFATSQDAVTVQSYLQSRDAMLRLDQDLGFKAHFSQPFIDPLQRLAPDASNEAAYKVYKRNVKIGYDPNEGLIKMEVTAADPEVSKAFSEALIGYAEEQVDQLTERLRADKMKGAQESYDKAERDVKAAQDRILELQKSLGVLDPASESSVVMSRIAALENELQKKQLELDQLLDNPQPNKARVSGVQGDISRLEDAIAQWRAQLTEEQEGRASLSLMSAQLQLAQSELVNRQQLLSLALQQMESARIEANRQVRYLSMGVAPVAPDEATYPRAFENTAVAFLIFAGIYLMISITVSVLREQASA